MLRAPLERLTAVPCQPFPEPVEETVFHNLAAKRAIADLLNRPLAKLSPEDLAFVDALLSETLDRRAVIGKVCQRFGLPPREI